MTHGEFKSRQRTTELELELLRGRLSEQVDLHKKPSYPISLVEEMAILNQTKPPPNLLI